MNHEKIPADGQRRTVLEARPSPHLAEVNLAELRVYRERLREEEDRISYWRRVIHARVDLIRDGALRDTRIDVGALARVLGDTGTGRMRQALHRVHAAEPLPDLPDLEHVWITPRDESETTMALERLSAAERTLTQYRRSLHERIDEATAELIVRYRESPSLALEVLQSGLSPTR